MPGPIVSAAGLRIVKLLTGRPPQSVDALAAAAGVTRTAVAEQLNALMAAGFVRRSIEQFPGRGRSRYVYSVTDSALSELYPGNQRLLVPALWDVIEGVGGADMKAQVLERVGLALAEHYKRRIKGRTPAARLRQMARVLRQEEGNLVEVKVTEDGRLAMCKRNCSFSCMFEESRSVCRVDEAMLTAVVGARVRRTACRHDGDPCCIFQIIPDAEDVT